MTSDNDQGIGDPAIDRAFTLGIEILEILQHERIDDARRAVRAVRAALGDGYSDIPALIDRLREQAQRAAAMLS
jgi:hypothetical protein